MAPAGPALPGCGRQGGARPRLRLRLALRLCGRPLYWPVDNYFYPGLRQTVFLGQEVPKYHHTLTQILGGLLRAGFVLEAVEEAFPAPETLAVPGMRDEMRRPMMLLVRAGKPV